MSRTIVRHSDSIQSWYLDRRAGRRSAVRMVGPGETHGGDDDDPQDTQARRRVGRGPGVEGLESRQLLTALITEYKVPNPSTGGVRLPGFIAVGSDGNIYFSQQDVVETRLGQMFGESDYAFNPTTGVVLPYIPPPGVDRPPPWTPMVPASDGNLWYVGPGANEVSNINSTTGAVTHVMIPGDTPSNLTAGPGGSLFFTDSPAGKIGQIDPATHNVVEYPLSKTTSAPFAMVLGSDGLLWFTEAGGNAIGSIDPATHAIAEYALPSQTERPGGIINGSDGNLWLVVTTTTGDFSSGYIDKFDPTTHAFTEFTGIPTPTGLSNGPDGQVWFTAGRSFGEINPATGNFAIYAIPASQVSGSLVAAGGLVLTPGGRLFAVDVNQVDEATVIPANVADIQGVVATNVLGGTGFSNVVAGQVVYLDLNGDGRLDNNEPTQTTNTDGYYTFTNLAPGTYTIRVAYPATITTYPAGGAQTVILSGGFLGQPPAFGVVPSSGVLPLSFSTNPFGSSNPDVSTAEVNGLFQTILGRAPNAGELSGFVAYLKAGNSIQTAAAILLHTGEYEGRIVASDYANILGRVATPPEIAAWVRVIQQQKLTAEQVSYDLMTSTEFNASHADGASFVSAVYEVVLGRPAADFEVAAWGSVFAAGVTRSTMVYNMIHSSFAAQRAVAGFGAMLWATTLDASTSQFVVNYLVNGGTLADVASAFAALPGFVNRANATVV